MEANQISGAILALALGDAFGAPFEGGPIERLLWLFIGKVNGKHRYTDDTQMTINVIESLLANHTVDQNDLAQRFADSYRFSRGYGPGVSKVLKLINKGTPWQDANRAVFRDGSFGNGGAMRSPAVGLFYADKDEDELCSKAYEVSVITHGHPLGIEGAILIALATALSFKRMESDVLLERLLSRAKTQVFADKLQKAKSLLQQPSEVKPKMVAKTLGNGISAIDSSVTAIFIALKLKHHSFDELLDFSRKVGGDVDTISAMAGAIWGANRGVQALPKDKLDLLENHGKLQKLSRQFSDMVLP